MTFDYDQSPLGWVGIIFLITTLGPDLVRLTSPTLSMKFLAIF